MKIAQVIGLVLLIATGCEAEPTTSNQPDTYIPQDENKDHLCKKQCQQLGACKFKQMYKGEPDCRVATAADCAASDICKNNGECDRVVGCMYATEPYCAATWEDHYANGSCTKSLECIKNGRCSPVPAINRKKDLSKCKDKNMVTCIVKTNADCEQSEACKQDGKCTVKNGYCQKLKK